MALVAIGEPAASPGRAAALAATLRDHPVPAAAAAAIAAAAQDAIVAALVQRVDRALAATPGASLVVGGGVAANTSLRDGLRAIALHHGRTFNVPPVRWCTDNAAMIGAAAHAALREGRAQLQDSALGVSVSASWQFGEAAAS
jgi:N6-L-threonylcarbamoyladenine synthase